MILFTMFVAFFRVGMFSFGGGLAMLPLIFQTVEQFGYMSKEEFANLVALSQITPGPVAVNAATYVGYNFAGIPGALVATFGVAIPSFLLIITVVKFMNRFSESRILEAAFTGIRPATVGLVGAAALFVGETSLIVNKHPDLIPCIIFAVSFGILVKTKLSPVKLMLIMAAVGVIFCS